jgi:predicted PurR-regulated permease PerM
LAYSISGFIVVGFFGLLFYVFGVSLANFISNMPSVLEDLKLPLQKASTFLANWGYEINANQLFEMLDINGLLSTFTQTLGGVGSILSKLLLVIIGTFFILAEYKVIEDKLNTLSKNFDIKVFISNIQNYFIVKSFTSFLTGFTITLGLLYFDVEYPILLGFLAFVLNFIPVIGSIIASIPALILSFIYIDFATTMYVLIFYLVVNISVSNILEPKLMGKELGISPSLVFFSLIFWGWVLGIAGAFLAIPITMSVKLGLESGK